MIVSLLVVGFIAWAMLGAVEDTIRAGRGDAPAGPRKGFRGYLDDRWEALADRHHANKEAGLLSGADKWAHRRHLARKKALARAGYRTDEDIARAAVEHQRRLGLIRQGVDPDAEPDEEEHLDEIPVLGLTDWVPPDYYEEYEVDLDAVPKHIEEQIYDDTINQRQTDWSPFSTEPKEHHMTEINSPADVKAFHDRLKTALATVVQIVDDMNGIQASLTARAADYTANLAATETAAAGMETLGMAEGAAAAQQLIDVQQTIADTLTGLAGDISDRTAALHDASQAATRPLDQIYRAYQAQLTVADTRAGVGRGNLARDAFSDGDV